MENSLHDRDQSLGTMSKSMLIVMIFTMVGKLSGYVREMVLASYYGAGNITDAFKTAQNLPTIILTTLVTALCATFIPAYSTQLKQGKEKANRFVNNIFTIGLLISIVVLILTTVFLEPLAGAVMQYETNTETRRIAIELARYMMPMGIFVFLARMTSAYLQANFNFTVPALSQLFLNFAIIAAIMISKGADILYVAIGTVLGWALQFAVQLPSMRKTGYRMRPVIDFKDSGLREILILMLPVLVSSAFDQVYMTFDMMVAYRGAVGDPSRLDYANRISTMVSSVLLTTVATVMYPNLVRNADDRKRFSSDLSFGINLNLLIAIPAIVAIVMLCLPITRLVYERNQFTAQDTLATAPLLACYAAGIFGVGLRELCNRAFYALKNTILPTIVGVIVVLLNIGLNYALHAVWGATGIAAATAISMTLSGFVLLFVLQRRMHVIEGKRVLRCLWKTAVATGAMAAVLFLLEQVFHTMTVGGSSLLLGLVVMVGAGIVVYAGVLLLLKTEELSMVVRFIKGKLRRS